MWFIFWIFIIILLFSSGGWYGYRRSYYGPPVGFGIIIFLWIIFILAIAFAGPWYGYYGRVWW